MFTSNTTQQQFDDYQTKFEDPKVRDFEIKYSTLSETKISVIWDNGHEESVFIASDEMETLNSDEAIKEYIEIYCVD